MGDRAQIAYSESVVTLFRGWRSVVTPQLEEIEKLLSIKLTQVFFNLKMVSKMCNLLFEESKFTPIDPIPLLYLQDPYIALYFLFPSPPPSGV